MVQDKQRQSGLKGRRRLRELCPPEVWLAAVLLILIGLSPGRGSAEPVSLVITPVNSQVQTRINFEPLAHYLSRQTGLDVQLKTSPNFLAFWETLRRGEYDMLLAPAHFTDYLATELGYAVVAKVPGVLSFTLLSRDDDLILDPEELIAQPVASLESPGLGGVFFEQMFPDVVQRPVFSPAVNTQAAVSALMDGKVRAALIPSPMVGALEGVSVIDTTDQVPALGFSVSPRASEANRQMIRDALVRAGQTPEGRKMLEIARLPGFEATQASMYTGFADLLQGTWGYEDASRLAER